MPANSATAQAACPRMDGRTIGSDWNSFARMTKPQTDSSAGRPGARLKQPGGDPRKEPDWTRGLKRLYDQVLEEPVPDTFKDLLSKLDYDPKQ